MDEKKALSLTALLVSRVLILIVPAQNAQDLQQAEEQVIDGHVQADSCHDVVCLSTVNDVAGFKQDYATHQQDKHSGYSE